MTTYYDDTHWDKSPERRRRHARAQYETAKMRMEASRARLLEAYEKKSLTALQPEQYEDIWGKVTRLAPVELAVNRGAERSFRHRQYLLDSEWYLRALLEYERLKTQPKSYRRPEFAPRKAPAANPRGPLGVVEPAERGHAEWEAGVHRQRIVLRDLAESTAEAERKRTNESVDELLLDMEKLIDAGLHEDPRLEQAWATVGDILEEHADKAIAELLAQPTRKNLEKTLRAAADAQMVGREAPRAWAAVRNVVERFANKATSEFRKRPTATAFDKAVDKSADAQLFGAGASTDLFDVGPRRLKRPGTYMVHAGDSLSKIARSYYGDPSRWPPIYLHNLKTIGNDPRVIKPGTVLNIP